MSTPPRNTFAEKDRLRQLAELDAEAGPGWSEENRPGSFGCHELLDRTSLVADLLEERILAHPACIANPDWYALAEQAVTTLRELYQRVGADHLEEREDEKGGS